MPDVRSVVVAIVLVAAGLGTWLTVTNDAPVTPATATSPPPHSVAAMPARIVTADELPALAADLGHPVYWLGERGELRLEWTVRPDGSAILRYLPAEVPAGEPGAFLSVATYPLANATDAVEQGSQRPGALSDVAPGGGRATTASADAVSAYLAVPGQPVLAEVYSPIPGRAYDLIRGGQLQLVPKP